MRQNIKTDRQIPVRSIPRLSGMGKYLAFFRLHFTMGLQYRTAAFAGIATQFVWGAMEILMFRAFYQTPDNGSFPMTFEATCAYVWMQQAFLALFMAWMMDNDIFTCIMDGNVSYELCRPIDLYHMWFSRSLASRCSKAVLRCMPILLVAAFLPKPYGLMAPVDAAAFLLFLLTLATGLAVTVAFCMLIYISAFFTLSPDGIRMVAMSVVEFFSGAVIPLPFFPDRHPGTYGTAALRLHAECPPADLQRRFIGRRHGARHTGAIPLAVLTGGRRENLKHACHAQNNAPGRLISFGRITVAG